MQIFLTGATGFIGAHLARRLAADGHQLTCLVRRPQRAQELQALGARLVTGDISDRDVVRSGVEGCQWVFHLANLYSMWEPHPAEFQRVNVDGTRHLLEASLSAGVQKFVYVSTVAVYGVPSEVPFSESSAAGPVLLSEYARSKAAANELAWQFARAHGLPLVVLYPGIVLGAGDNKPSGQYIYDLVHRRAPSTIFHHSTSTYVAVGDVVEALVQAAARDEAAGQRYLIGGHPLNGGEFAQAVERASGVARPIFQLPDWVVLAAAHLLTRISALTRRPPPWGLSVEAARTLKHGFRFDGSKAERELGVRYTPIEAALAEDVKSQRGSRTKK